MLVHASRLASSFACSSCSCQRLTAAPLSLKKSSIAAGLVTATELAELCALLGETLDAEASKRVHCCTLLAAQHVPQAPASARPIRTEARAQATPAEVVPSTNVRS